MNVADLESAVIDNPRQAAISMANMYTALLDLLSEANVPDPQSSVADLHLRIAAKRFPALSAVDDLITRRDTHGR